MTGGKRPGAGRPATPLDEKRMMTLIDRGVTGRDIAKAFGVIPSVIARRVVKIRKQRALHENNRPDS